MNDLPDNTPDVTVLLGEVQVPQLGRSLVVVGVGLEDTPGLPLGSDDSLRCQFVFLFTIPYSSVPPITPPLSSSLVRVQCDYIEPNIMTYTHFLYV